MHTTRSRRLLSVLLTLVVLAAGCGGDEEPAPPGWYELPRAEAAQYETAYIAAVQVPVDGSKGYILLRNNWDGRADLGGWAIRGRDLMRIPIPPSTFIEPKSELRVHLGKGESDADDLYVTADAEIREWDRLTLVDSGDKRVAHFAYGR